MVGESGAPEGPPCPSAGTEEVNLAPSMTAGNLNKLMQITRNLRTDNNGVEVNLLLRERPPRQLLVNESVLKKNQMYRKQVT